MDFDLSFLTQGQTTGMNPENPYPDVLETLDLVITDFCDSQTMSNFHYDIEPTIQGQKIIRFKLAHRLWAKVDN